MTSKDLVKRLEETADRIRMGELNWFQEFGHAHPRTVQGILIGLGAAIGFWVRGWLS